MKKLQIVILLVLNFLFSSAQTAEEFNAQANALIRSENLDKALPLLRKAAELGNAEAQYNFGYFLQNGIGIEKNPEEAVKWYKESSDNHFNDGHYAMMMAYGNGNGIEQNSKMAFEYALKCAGNNDPTCMWNVVNCYITGNGVEQSIGKFREWIVRLAKLENPENLTQSGYITSARLEIARGMKNGKYFDQDPQQSYLWYITYNESKRDFSILEQQKVIEEIKELEKSLLQEQISSGERDAEALLGRKLLNYSQLYKTSL